MARSFLKIDDPSTSRIQIQGALTHDAEMFRDYVWSRGNPTELNELFSQLSSNMHTFWGAKGSLAIRKMHTGLPRIIINKLVDITVADLNGITVNDPDKVDDEAQLSRQHELWEAIATENDFMRIAKRSTKKALALGDGAFKLTYDPDISKLPIIEFYGGDRVDFIYKKGRLTELVFYSSYKVKDKVYELAEHYGFGYINYRLTHGGKECELARVPDLAQLVDLTFDDSYIFGVPYVIFETDRDDAEGRGQSILAGKSDAFDALDESISQWWQALRDGRTRVYIPDNLLPRDPNGGTILKPNPFDNAYIALGSNMQETGEDKVSVVEPQLQTDKYLESYITALDLCLEGLISPSTLGIDVKKLDNAEAQREKEKTTLYTRQAIVDALGEVIASLVATTLQFAAVLNSVTPEAVVVDVQFGEYANPSFEAQVETLSDPNTPMSIEARVDELYGDNKTQEWKDGEVDRIKAERGLGGVGESALEQDYGSISV